MDMGLKEARGLDGSPKDNGGKWNGRKPEQTNVKWNGITEHEEHRNQSKNTRTPGRGEGRTTKLTAFAVATSMSVPKGGPLDRWRGQHRYAADARWHQRRVPGNDRDRGIFRSAWR